MKLKKRTSQNSGFSSKRSGVSQNNQLEADDTLAPPETAEDFMNKTGQSFAIAPKNSEVRKSLPGMNKSPMTKNKSGSFRSRGSSNHSLGSKAKSP